MWQAASGARMNVHVFFPFSLHLIVIKRSGTRMVKNRWLCGRDVLNKPDPGGAYRATDRAGAIRAFNRDVVEKLRSSPTTPVNISHVFYYSYDSAGKSPKCDHVEDRCTRSASRRNWRLCAPPTKPSMLSRSATNSISTVTTPWQSVIFDTVPRRTASASVMTAS